MDSVTQRTKRMSKTSMLPALNHHAGAISSTAPFPLPQVLRSRGLPLGLSSRVVSNHHLRKGQPRADL